MSVSRGVSKSRHPRNNYYSEPHFSILKCSTVRPFSSKERQSVDVESGRYTGGETRSASQAARAGEPDSSQPTLERYLEQPAGRRVPTSEDESGESDVSGRGEGDRSNDGNSPSSAILLCTTTRLRCYRVAEESDDVACSQAPPRLKRTRRRIFSSREEDAGQGRGVLQEGYMTFYRMSPHYKASLK